MDVDNGHWGSFHTCSSDFHRGWTFHGNHKAEAILTTDDRKILINMILDVLLRVYKP